MRQLDLFGNETPPTAREPAPDPAAEPAAEPEQVRWTPDGLRAAVMHRSGYTFSLAVTDNARNMITYQPASGNRPAELRVHRMFLDASDAVVAALGDWVQPGSRNRAGKMLDAFIREHRHAVRPRRRRVTLVTRGHVHDLQALYDEVNATEFGGAVDAPITWGQWANRGRRRSIRFGSYSQTRHLIRIHPALDRASVPRFFVRYVVFHEMLHAHMGIGESETGRRRIHPPEFKRREQQYPEYERAIAWMEAPENLHPLLSRR